MKTKLGLLLLMLMTTVGCDDSSHSSDPKSITTIGIAPMKGDFKKDEKGRIAEAWLEFCQISDDDLRTLENEDALKVLDLSNNNITDAGLAYVGQTTQLEALYLSGNLLSEKGIAHLKGLHNLESLGLGSEVTNTALVHLAGLTKLKWLGLEWGKFNDLGLESLEQMKGIEVLDLRKVSGVNGSGFVYLKQMTNLRELWLQNTSVTDESLVHLEGLTNLQRLDLTYTRVTEQGVSNLKAKLPNCEVTW